MKAVICSVFLALCLFGVVAQAAMDRKTCNIVSTGKIIGKLCYGCFGSNRANQTLIDGFFGCYTEETAKDIFVDCQIKAFNGAMNNTANLKATCFQPWKVSKYTACLKEEFAQSGKDMDSIVEQINNCQSNVMNIKPGYFCQENANSQEQ